MSRLPLVLAFVMLGSVVSAAQSLADVARAEAARRQAVTTPARVYTNESLRPDFTKAVEPAPVPAPDTASDTELTTETAPQTPAPPGLIPLPPAAEPPTQRDQAYWSARIGAARGQVERSRILADALQSRVNALATDFVNRDDPAQRAQIEQERLKALAELERVQRAIEDQAQAVADIEEEARRAGVPPGWLRP